MPGGELELPPQPTVIKSTLPLGVNKGQVGTGNITYTWQ